MSKSVIALYIRLSIEDSKVDSMSIENQRLVLHKFADSLDIPNCEVREFVDNGYSGMNFERPAVQELIELVLAGQINSIIVKDFTRFGRNSVDVGYYMEMVFPLYGVRFISLNDDYDSADHPGETGGMSVAFKYLVSEFYSRDLSVKYKSAKYVKFRRGEYQSKICPYGYQKSADGRMEPDPETAPNVRMIFELAAQGKNTTAIINELFQRRIPTPGEYKASKGISNHDVSRCRGIWGRSSVLNILRDERYTGTYIIGKRESREVGSTLVRLKDESQWVKIPNHHPAIIPKEQYDLVQDNIKRPKCVKKKTHFYTLYEKVYCGYCHHRMSRIGSKTFRFHCKHTMADEGAPCHGMKISEDDLNNIVLEQIKAQAEILLKQSKRSAEGQVADTVYSTTVEEYQEQKLRLYEQMISGEISSQDYMEQKAQIDIELAAVRNAVVRESVPASAPGNSSPQKKNPLHMAQDAEKLTAELVEAFIEKVNVFPGQQVTVIWKSQEEVL